MASAPFWWLVRRWLLHLAAGQPPAEVLVVGAWRAERETGALESRLRKTRHRLTLIVEPPDKPRFAALNDLLAKAGPLKRFDWVIVVDDDVTLPHRFIDAFLCAATLFRFAIAQPAHLPSSHAAWPLTRRQAAIARRTEFVEIGPVVAFAREAQPHFLPFPDVGMGWGLDAHWSALIRRHRLAAGIIDAVAIRHEVPAAGGYSRAAAIAEAQSFLAVHPFLPVGESQRTLVRYRRFPNRGWPSR